MLRILLKSIKFETKNEAEHRHHALARLIARQSAPLERLKKLAACSSQERCGLDGCHLCGRRFRKQLIKQVRRLKLDEGAWTRASLILLGHEYPAGGLSDVDLNRLTKAVAKRLERSGFADAIVIAGWDISFNTFDNVENGWNLHLYLLVNLPDSARLQRQMVQALKLSLSAMRPKSIKPVRDDETSFFKAVSYSHKIMFSRRSGYYRLGRVKLDGTPSKDVRDLPLKPPQQLELATWLSQYPVGARLIMRNIKRLNPPKGRLRLGLLKPMHVALRP